jgi:hypothetical protein
MAKTYYYAIVNKNGNLVTTDHKLPFYWNKNVVIQDRIKLCGDSDRIVPIKIEDIKKLLKDKQNGNTSGS